MSFFGWIAGLFSKFIKAFKSFIDIAFPVVSQIIIGKLKDVALQIVTELAATDLSNEDKRNEAFKRIGEYATAQGLSVKDSLINVIIELAVQAFKNEE